MTTDDREVAPTDEEDHPIHPEKGYRICGAPKSDRTTPTSHGRERDDVDYCLQRAGWGTDREVGPCRDHPFEGSQVGKSNPNFKHGAFSELFRSDLSERERAAFDEALDAVDDPEEIKEVLATVAIEHILKGKRSGDPRLTREGRQLLAEFNIVKSPEQVEVEHSGSVDTELSVPDHVAEAIASNAESNLEDGGG